MKLLIRFLAMLAVMLSGSTEKIDTTPTLTAEDRLAAFQLVGIEHDRVNGSIWGEDEFIYVTRDSIEDAMIFIEENDCSWMSEYFYNYYEMSDVPISSAQWDALEKAFTEALPYMEEISVPSASDPGDVQALDGPNYDIFYLHWCDTSGGVQRVPYRYQLEAPMLEASALLTQTVRETAEAHEMENSSEE